MPTGKKSEPTAFTLALHAELRAWAGRRGFSFRRLADESGVNRGRIQKTISADLAPIDMNELDDICKALQVAPKDVVDAAERMLKQQGHHLTTNYQLLAQEGYTLAASHDRRPTADANEADYL